MLESFRGIHRQSIPLAHVRRLFNPAMDLSPTGLREWIMRLCYVIPSKYVSMLEVDILYCQIAEEREAYLYHFHRLKAFRWRTLHCLYLIPCYYQIQTTAKLYQSRRSQQWNGTTRYKRMLVVRPEWGGCWVTEAIIARRLRLGYGMIWYDVCGGWCWSWQDMTWQWCSTTWTHQCLLVVLYAVLYSMYAFGTESVVVRLAASSCVCVCLCIYCMLVYMCLPLRYACKIILHYLVDENYIGFQLPQLKQHVYHSTQELVQAPYSSQWLNTSGLAYVIMPGGCGTKCWYGT